MYHPLTQNLPVPTVGANMDAHDALPTGKRMPCGAAGALFHTAKTSRDVCQVKWSNPDSLKRKERGLLIWYDLIQDIRSSSYFYMSAVMKHFSARVVVSAAINKTWGRCPIFMDRNGIGDWINVVLANSDFKSKRLKEDETEKRCSWTDGLSFPLNIHDFFCLFYCWSLVSSPSPASVRGSTSQP